MVIRNGSIYWVDFSPGKGSEPLGRRPGLVVQTDALNDSKLSTVIVVAITSTLKFGELPGNVFSMPIRMLHTQPSVPEFMFRMDPCTLV